jgi:3-methyladenine DNA glycosylase/8-oxoguanine DNA glycosylase
LSLVTFTPPVDIAASLELFRRSGDDLIDRWDGTRLVRVLRLGVGYVPFVGTLREGGLQVCPADPAVLDAVRATFFEAPAGWPSLLHRDPVLRELELRFPGVRQPRQLDLFTALVRCISAQQVNLRWAVTTRRRLAEKYGLRHEIDGHVVYTLEPSIVADVEPAEIRALQFTTSKSRAIAEVAKALAAGDVTLEGLSKLSNEEVIPELVKLRGIGRWSAEWVLARTMGRPVVVAGDLGVRKAVGLAYLGTPLPSELDVRRATEHWGESAGVAQALLLHALGEGALAPAGLTSRA